MYRYNIHNMRKFQYSISTILETNKQKYKKNRDIIRRQCSSKIPGGPPEYPWWVLLLSPIALNIIYNIRKTR